MFNVDLWLGPSALMGGVVVVSAITELTFGIWLILYLFGSDYQ
jgi:hypothetical protein